MAKQNQSSNEFDEMDVVMSQLDTNVFVVQENDGDEMDEIMSQIDLESLCDPERKVDDVEFVYEMDEPDETVDVPQELLERYEEAMDGIQDELIIQMEHEEDVEEELELSPDLLQEFEKAMNAILPKKSADRYLQAYEVVRNWQKSYRTKSLDERVIMAYFSEASAKYKPSTCWSMYSMLKKTMIVKHNVDLKNYCRLRAFLKTNSDGYQSKQSLVFTPEGLRKFIVDAPDISYLAMKVEKGQIFSFFLYNQKFLLCFRLLSFLVLLERVEAMS